MARYSDPLFNKTQALIDADRKPDDGGPGFAIRQTIRNIFEARYTTAFTADHLYRLALAWDQWSFVEADFKSELSGFVRRKVLRSYVAQGKRYYEVNY